MVIKVIPNGGAAEVGLALGDAVTSINEVPVKPMTFADAVPLLRGPEGTTVRLVVVKAGNPQQTVDRDGVQTISNPVSVDELFATLWRAMGIDLEDRNLDLHDNLGRRYYIAGEQENATPIRPLLSDPQGGEY